MKQIEHSVDIRVRYKETDQMGMAYYSNYLVWFEIARTELFRAKGIEYKGLEKEEKVFLPVIEAYCRYKAPLRYDDSVVVTTVLKRSGRIKLHFDYEIKKDGEITTTGYTKHVFINEAGEPVAMSEKIKKLFK